MQIVCISKFCYLTMPIVTGLVFLSACSQVAVGPGRGALNPAQQQMLDSSLKVSAAAIETGQPVAAGRASLGREDFATAKTHFLAATELAKGTPVESWVINGLAVVAALEGDYPLAEQHYKAALALVPHPLITANLMRMLVEAGRIDEARQLHASHSDTYWAEGDRDELPHLLKTSATDKRETE